MGRGDTWLVGAILLVAAAFRFNGLLWDDGALQHPDERFLIIVASEVALPASLGDYFATQHSTLNPYNRTDAAGRATFAYGQLPLTLVRAAAEATGQTAYPDPHVPGRVLVVLADVATVLFTWLLARRIFRDTRHAHLAALFLAISVLPIQLAHFFTVDPLFTLLAAVSLFFLQRAWQRQKATDAFIAGVGVGLAMACKISALALLPVMLLATFWPRVGRLGQPDLVGASGRFGSAILGMLLAFRLAEPYAFVGPAAWDVLPNATWFADKFYWAAISSGAIDVPFMIQWVGTPPYLFVGGALVRWGLGPALGVAALAGFATALWRCARGDVRAREALLIVAWVGLNAMYFGGQFAKFMRYLLPVYFALTILAAYGLLLVVDWSSRVRAAHSPPPEVGLEGLSPRREPHRDRPWRIGALAVLVAVIILTAGWALAFSQIYASPPTRIEASRWIYANVPLGSVLGVEHWDDSLPLGMGAFSTSRCPYQVVPLTLYDPDTPTKRHRLLRALESVDYIILASRRLADSIPRLPLRYPLSSRYYELLQEGRLGFERVAEFRQRPHLGLLVFHDDQAPEDFQVYDHPAVEIWAKGPDYSPQAVAIELPEELVEQAHYVRPVDGAVGPRFTDVDDPPEAQAQRLVPCAARP